MFEFANSYIIKQICTFVNFIDKVSTTSGEFTKVSFHQTSLNRSDGDTVLQAPVVTPKLKFLKNL